MKESRLLLISMLFMLLLNSPILAIANRPERVLGIPVLYLYVFTVWASLIGGIGWLIHRTHSDDSTTSNE
ncbi:hypothetical protein [Spirosoma fluviale]|uniref:DUF3311 domain-containing protein n=2 Tax=Spirosoma TaxID=107 RepID=D2QCT6_SPILD|nr:hypothetical protein [Spirosoma fluviale]ADB38091.1 hypothetical protein Slin_2046 [Spirosoma linguale DSM 74]SOD82099.1 hypothetical protein SAMN06269250_2020 [Spirosoma fluviale]